MYGLAQAGAMGTININLVQCFLFASFIVAVDPVAVSNHHVCHDFDGFSFLHQFSFRYWLQKVLDIHTSLGTGLEAVLYKCQVMVL